MRQGRVGTVGAGERRGARVLAARLLGKVEVPCRARGPPPHAAALSGCCQGLAVGASPLRIARRPARASPRRAPSRRRCSELLHPKQQAVQALKHVESCRFCIGFVEGLPSTGSAPPSNARQLPPRHSPRQRGTPRGGPPYGGPEPAAIGDGARGQLSTAACRASSLQRRPLSRVASVGASLHVQHTPERARRGWQPCSGTEPFLLLCACWTGRRVCCWIRWKRCSFARVHIP